MNGKMLFSKISLVSFAYDIVDVFAFPDDDVKDVFPKVDVTKSYLYLILTDVDSVSLQFIFICKVSCGITEEKASELIFEILIKLKIKGCLDLSDNFWVIFNAQNKGRKKKFGLYFYFILFTYLFRKHKYKFTNTSLQIQVMILNKIMLAGAL